MADIVSTSDSTNVSSQALNPKVEIRQIGIGSNANLNIGSEAQYHLLGNGAPIPSDELSNPTWTLFGNVRAYRNIDYNQNEGKVIPWPDNQPMMEYPLSLCLQPNGKPSNEIEKCGLEFVGKWSKSKLRSIRAAHSQNVIFPGQIKDVQTKREPTTARTMGSKLQIGTERPGGLFDASLAISCTFTSTRSTGRLYPVFLVNGYIWHQLPDADRIYETDTKNKFVYVGRDYPGLKITNIDKAGDHEVEFIIEPSVELGQLKKSFTILHVKEEFRIFFLYDDPAAGISPILVAPPQKFSWEVECMKRFTDPWLFKQRDISTVTSDNEWKLPTWEGRWELEDSFTEPPGDPADATQDSLLSTSSEAIPPSRSVRINLENASPDDLFRDVWQIKHGKWSEGMLPPERIAGYTRGTWASESSLPGTGVEGECSYLLSDRVSRVKIYWKNPYWADADYDIEVSGPLAEKYKGTWSGGLGHHSTVDFKLELR